MATILAPSGYVDYQIDVTEVTKGQYDAWLVTNPPLPASMDTNCGYVTSYSEQGSIGVWAGADAEHHPVADVDWCDASEYCQGVGKRLCGAIRGGPDDWTNSEDATKSQWYRTCSGGMYRYPYGSTYQSTYCDGYDYWNNLTTQPTTVEVGSLENCVTSATGYAGVFDLSGNVGEWEDSCSAAGMSTSCHVRGGALNDLSDGLTCLAEVDYPRNEVNHGIGFRCCSQ
jgi:formylglycine-generating enzyme required for sulfatase activity